jgi:hypothetical protein
MTAKAWDTTEGASDDVSFYLQVEGEQQGSGDPTALLTLHSHIDGTFGDVAYFRQNGSLYLKEQAAADVDEASWGQIWVKNDAPNTLWFTDDTGVDIQIDLGGDLAHRGTNVGFYGTTPVAQSTAYSPTNVTTDRTYDANSTSLDEVADVLGTLIADLQATGLIG